VETSRLEAFSDGVFAIAITLLVLVFLEKNLGEGHLGHELTGLWPSYLAYVLSFVTIGIIWVNHHALFRHIASADRALLFLNIFVLVPIVFVPFPTDVLAEFIRTDDAQAAALLYGCNFTVMALFLNALWHYARLRGLLGEELDAREVSGITRSYAVGPVLYGTAAAVALVSPVASASLYAVIALFYVSASIWGGSAGE
jgi:uncharacterized membrane protein